MKKKVKELTRSEFKNICNKYDACKGCPFIWMTDCLELEYYLKTKDIEKALEQEIEVDSNEKEDNKIN